MTLPAIKPHPRQGNERFRHGNIPLPFGLMDFWSWSSSDLIGNALRGVLAEFLVAKALGVAEGSVRTEWDAWDVVSKDGFKVEVKSAAYIQSWEQSDYSKIGFDIGPKQSWDAETNDYWDTPERRADVYVFCLVIERDQDRIDPMDVSQWQFLVMSARKLDEVVGNQKRISLAPLLKIGPTVATFEQLGSAIAGAADRRVEDSD